MTFQLPNPNAPATSDALTSLPIRQNFQAIAAGLQALDGTALNTKSVSEGALADAINPRLRQSEWGQNFVYTGLTIATSGTLTSTITAGTAYVNGFRVVSPGVASQAFTASKDTYVDMDISGNFTLQAVTNGAASPSLAANSVRLAIVITSASAITTVNQGSTAATGPTVASNILTVCDSLGNLIYPTSPAAGLIGYRQTTTNFSTVSVTAVQITGLSCPVIVPTGRKVKVTVAAGSAYNGAANNAAIVTVWDGTVGTGTQLGLAAGTSTTAATNQNVTAIAVATPTTSSKTYNAGFACTGGNTANTNATPTQPVFISVELV